VRRSELHGVRPTRIVAMLVAALVLSACSGIGGGADVEDDPQAALVEAFDDLGSWTGIVVDLRLEADATARAALLEDEELSAEAADTLFASSLRVTASGEDDEAGFTFAVIVEDTELAELRLVEDDRLFVRIDIDTITSLADDAEVEDFDADELILAARMFGAGDAAEALVNGGWVELIGIDDLAELAGESPEEADEADADEAEQVDALVERFAADMTALIEQDAEVTYVASEDAGDRVRVTAPTDELADVLDRFLDDLTELTGDVVDDEPQQLADDLGETVTLDVWIDDGSITQIGFDPATVEDAEPIDGEVLILAALAEFDGAIEAPSDATTFDVLQIVGAFFGGLGPGADPFGGGAFEDDGFGEDDPFDDGVEGDEPGDGTLGDDAPEPGTDDAFGDDTSGDPELACISEEEIAEIESVLGPEALAEIEELIEAGLIERC
jgi:hypothetical protein